MLSSNDIVQREQGFGAWLGEAPPPEGNGVNVVNICQADKKRRKLKVLLWLNNVIFKA